MSNNLRLAMKKLSRFECPHCESKGRLELRDQITVERSWPLEVRVKKEPHQFQLETEPFFIVCRDCDARFPHEDIPLTEKQWEDLTDYVQR